MLRPGSFRAWMLGVYATDNKGHEVYSNAANSNNNNINNDD